MTFKTLGLGTIGAKSETKHQVNSQRQKGNGVRGRHAVI